MIGEVMFYESDFLDPSRYRYASEQFKKALREAIADEREACARVAEEEEWGSEARNIAAAIRARSNPETPA
jgi:multidrug resistance efflux pump